MNIKLLGIMLSLFMLTSSILYATQYISNNNSVDDGEIRWGGSTTYSSQWIHAITKWNAQGDINIAPDAWYTIEDLYIVDVNKPWASYYGRWIYWGSWYSDEIQFNKAKLSNKTDNQKKYTTMHELGHALGLDHHSISGNIMKEGLGSQTNLGSQDKSDYNYLWE